MPDNIDPDLIETIAALVDSSKNQLDYLKALDPPVDTRLAESFISDLLTELMLFARTCALDFERLLDRVRDEVSTVPVGGARYTVGSPVTMTGAVARQSAAAGLPTRGVITGEYAPNGFYVRCLGGPRSFQLAEKYLTRGPAFQPLSIHQAVIEDPLTAEKALVDTTAQIQAAWMRGVRPNEKDLGDQRALTNVLASWNGMDAERVTQLVSSKVSEQVNRLVAAPADHPAQLAGEDAVLSLDQGVPPPERQQTGRDSPPGPALGPSGSPRTKGAT
ncbi:hypothetical protein SMC26_24030 [Actinomadura fulvescens]|uniref:Uncharacterized protein n=1 Tax=Actinomadura fulvescens TaxID=46160 RepID=A0ABN3Q3C1_9ACTN